MSNVIEIKANWKPRDYQLPLFRFFKSGGKRGVAVWHRRAGKDTTALYLTRELALQRVGTYFHMLPTLRQGRMVIWDGINKAGQRMIDEAFPRALRTHTRNDEMSIDLVNGSRFQVVGSDNFNNLVGTNPVGVVMSEYSIADPSAWDFFRPILAENGGFFLAIYTPRGRNHGYELYQMAHQNPDWFAEVLSVDDTQAISEEVIHAERQGGMAEELIRQEFYCSFDAPLVGSIYGDEMFEAHQEDRITTVHHDKAAEVHTWWDLGHSDATAIWFVQYVGNEVHLIDYYQANGEDLSHYADVIKGKEAENRWSYGEHIWPHDGGAKTLASGGRPLNAMMADLGVKVKVQKRSEIWPGINKVRSTLGRCWFDEDKCRLGIEALKSYRKEEDESKSSMGIRYFKEKPLHDWASHAADAFRIGCMKGAARKQKALEYPEDHISRMVV